MESWLKPMLCGKADVVPEGDEWVAEPKLDGWRAVAHVNGDVKLYCGRNAAEYSGKLPYIESVLSAILPNDSAVDGELLGGEWGDVQGVMTRGQGPHVPSTAIPALTYVLFDVTRLDGVDLRPKPWSERRQHLEVLSIGIEAEAFGGNTPNVRVSPAGESSPETLSAMLELGMEGVVCKRRDGRYMNTRSNLWIKVKPQDTEDGTVIGFYDPTKGSKYDGNSVGGICFRLENGYEGRAAGMNDALRKEMYEHPERFIGRTVELKHHGMFDSGALRHPNFLRFRDDKDEPRGPLQGRAGHRKPKEAPKVANGPSPRNYGAMGDAKLLKCLKELSAGGDAHDRCVASGGNPAADLERASAIARERGLL